jgi:sugar (pentulose or hexulose) kinase
LTEALVDGDYQTRPYLDHRFLNTVTHIPAGRSLNVLVDLLSELARSQDLPLADPWPYLASAAEHAETLAGPRTEEQPGLQVDLAFFDGPLGNRGSITGITTDNLAVGPLFLAAFRAMARNYALLADRISPSHRWSRLVFSGGLAQNLAILRRLIRQSLPGDCRVCPETEDTLRGLLAAALVASRQSDSLADATRQLARDERG